MSLLYVGPLVCPKKVKLLRSSTLWFSSYNNAKYDIGKENHMALNGLLWGLHQCKRWIPCFFWQICINLGPKVEFWDLRISFREKNNILVIYILNISFWSFMLQTHIILFFYVKFVGYFNRLNILDSDQIDNLCQH